MKRITLISIILLCLTNRLSSQVLLKTVAEASDYQRTSLYADVMEFVKQLDKSSQFIRTETIAVTEEGREVPLVILANPMPKSPEDMKNDHRIVVYLQANIHAGEVEGKEALLMYMRDLINDKNTSILKDVVLLVCPIFNADGNEKISTRNRPNQNGPTNGVGVRYNGTYLDLNRDALKAESPEMKGLITNVFNKWDPYVIFDSHTTNGVFRQEPVTFSWMANPNGDRNLINYMRDKMMPTVSKVLLDKYKVENCFYGEFEDLGHPENGYSSYAHEPRYLVNYVGIRNRLGILNENYVYATFKERVEGTYALVKALMDYIVSNKNEIKGIVKSADERILQRWISSSSTDSFSFDYRVVPTPEMITIKIFEVEPDTNQNNYLRYKPTGVKKTLTIPYLADYVPNTSIAYPFAYIFNVPEKRIIENLTTHGVIIERLTENQTLEVERFQITDLKGSPRLNQGHYTNSVEGSFITESRSFEAGSFVVKIPQQMSNVIVYLLEPQSGEGLLYWNFFDRYLVPQWGRGFYSFPVYRINQKVELKSKPYIY